MVRRIVTTFALAALSWACGPAGTQATFTALGGDLDALRSAFNEQSGHVRVVMLAAPT